MDKPSPFQIYNQAKNDEEYIELMKKHGYVRDKNRFEEKAAQLWCLLTTSKIEMNPELCSAIARALKDEHEAGRVAGMKERELVWLRRFSDLEIYQVGWNEAVEHVAKYFEDDLCPTIAKQVRSLKLAGKGKS